MFAFFGHFSESFMMAVLLWPFAGMIVSIPVQFFQYSRGRAITKQLMLMNYFTVLYLLGLVLFTLYPVPDNPVAYCAEYALTPRLAPFASLVDISRDGLSAVLQIMMNILFFVPLGVIARSFFAWGIRHTVLVGFGVSVLIELAQATGVFGLYPCSYRLFDLDDLWINALGAGVGWWLGRFISFRKPSPRDNRARSYADRLMLAVVVDSALVWLLWLMVTFALRLARVDIAEWLQPVVVVSLLAVANVVVPTVWRGYTPAGYVVGATLDNRSRSQTGKRVLYLLRFGIIAVLVLRGDGLTAVIAMALTDLLYRSHGIMPYEIDYAVQRLMRR